MFTLLYNLFISSDNKFKYLLKFLDKQKFISRYDLMIYKTTSIFKSLQITMFTR